MKAETTADKKEKPKQYFSEAEARNLSKAKIAQWFGKKYICENSIMKILTISILLGTLFTISSCTKEKKFTACINSSEQTIEVFETITFVSCSENAETHLWDFKDGTTSDKATIAHQFNNVGTYDVSLTVTKGTEVSKTTKPIVVTPLPFDKNQVVGTFICQQTCSASPPKTYDISIYSDPSGNDKVSIANINDFNPLVSKVKTVSINSSTKKYEIDITDPDHLGNTIQGIIKFENDANTQFNLTYTWNGETCSVIGIKK